MSVKPSLESVSTVATDGTVTSNTTVAERTSAEAPSVAQASVTTTDSGKSTSTSVSNVSTVEGMQEGPVTFFTTLSRNYADVPITDDGVDTLGFLEATDGVLSLFDLLGPTAFGLVIKDMNGNLTKIRTRFLAAPLQSATLEQLVTAECADKKSKKTATEGLLWLLRGLQLTWVALRRSQNDMKEELSVSFTKSYETTLSKHHSFVIKPLFSIAMKACPHREDFYQKLGPMDQVNIELGVWVNALEDITERMMKYYTANKNFGL